MAPNRKRENRENQFYDVGVQGRKTGITLEDKGVRDEYGLEPISGIFSSPERSPPKRTSGKRQTEGTVTESESMELQESSIPELPTSAHILRNSRTHFPPPRSRSPMKTALGSSPRRQSSMGPKVLSTNVPSSPTRSASHPAVSRRLDFEQEDESLQETPALSGSGQRRGKRSNVYSVESSPSDSHSGGLDESMVQEKITANDESVIDTEVIEQSFVAEVGNDTFAGDEAVEESADIDESEVAPEPPKQPAKRGRKRKSEMVELPHEEEPAVARPRKRAAAAAAVQASEPRNKAKKTAPLAPVQPRRSKRVSDITDIELSNAADVSMDASEQVEEPPQAKRRGRPAKTKAQPEKAAEVKKKPVPAKQKPESATFQKPKAAAKPKAKVGAKASEKGKEPKAPEAEPGRLVDAYGKPLSKTELEKMSTTSAGSRYGRGRQLSVYRELDPDNVARIGRTGRHRVAPIDFWRNDKIHYDHQGGMQAIVRNENQEPVPVKKTGTAKGKGRKRTLTVVDEEQELEPWEEEEGILTGEYREFDAATEVNTDAIIEDKIAWAEKGINPIDVPDASFKFTKLASAGQQDPFFAWGFIELRPDQMKRTKNSRRMHMVFHVHVGAVEAKVHNTEFTVHKGGVFQVPRGNTYSIRNVSEGTSRVFFAQACELTVQAEEE